MGFGKSLKKIFIVEEEGKEEIKETPVIETKKIETIDVDSKVCETDVSKMIEMLGKALDEAQDEGFNYLKFKNAVQELTKEGTSEDSAIKSVFVTAKGMGLTKLKLITNIEKCLEIVKKEQQNFTKELTDKKQVDILDVEEQIKKIEDQITTLSKDKQKLEKDLSASKIKINNAEFAFKEAVDLVSKKIKADETKIKAILGE